MEKETSESYSESLFLYFFIKMGQVITVFLCKLLDGKKWFGRIYHKMTTLYKIFTFC